MLSFSRDLEIEADRLGQRIMEYSKYNTKAMPDFFVKLKRESQLLTVEQVAEYLAMLLVDIDFETFRSKEWDIYESYAQFPEE